MQAYTHYHIIDPDGRDIATFGTRSAALGYIRLSHLLGNFRIQERAE